MACRFFLGWAETMFGPGIPLYFSFFYPREMLGLRFGIFLSGAALANVYGNLLAYGLAQAHSSISSWKFLFIIEGVPTVLLAVVTYFFLPDSPTTAKFLNTREREVARQIATSQPDDYEHEGLQLGQVGEAFKDYKSMFCLIRLPDASFHSLDTNYNSRLSLRSNELQQQRQLRFSAFIPPNNRLGNGFIHNSRVERPSCPAILLMLPSHHWHQYTFR